MTQETTRETGRIDAPPDPRAELIARARVEIEREGAEHDHRLQQVDHRRRGDPDLGETLFVCRVRDCDAGAGIDEGGVVHRNLQWMYQCPAPSARTQRRMLAETRARQEERAIEADDEREKMRQTETIHQTVVVTDGDARVGGRDGRLTRLRHARDLLRQASNEITIAATPDEVGLHDAVRDITRSRLSVARALEGTHDA